MTLPSNLHQTEWNPRISRSTQILLDIHAIHTKAACRGSSLGRSELLLPLDRQKLRVVQQQSILHKNNDGRIRWFTRAQIIILRSVVIFTNVQYVLLTLDARTQDGGISGLSSLLIVREAMGHLQEKGTSDKPPEPWEYFDMIAGSGTGA